MGECTLVVDGTWDGTPVGPDESAHVRVRRDRDALCVDVDAPYHGDPCPPGAPGPCDGLWEHEVVEFFLAGAGTAYIEVELGPHGHHLVLRLADVRRETERALPLDYQAERAGARWRGRAHIPAAWLPAGPLRGNAYAIHGRGAARRYLAAHPVPGAAPDFHQPARFAPLPELDETRVSG
jgi:hypothetical protein